MKFDRRWIALAAMGLIVVGYLATMLVVAFGESSPPSVKKPTKRAGDTASAKIAAESAVRQIARRWETAELDRTMDPSVQREFWYESLKSQVELCKEHLGPLSTLNGDAAFKPRGDVDYYDYRGELECAKGRASVRLLLVASEAGWRVIGAEFTPRDEPETGVERSSKPEKPKNANPNSMM